MQNIITQNTAYNGGDCMNKKFIKVIKIGGMVYLVYKISTSTFFWTKMPDGSYENIYLVTELNDSLSEKFMNGLLKLRDYGNKFIKD